MRALPAHFHSRTNIEGLPATDLFSLNSLLASTIEAQVVEALNRMRTVWDPDDEWPLHRFERQAQTFPDVVLVAEGKEIAFGIELKGWYLLAKEGAPSFRYTASPAACAAHDLLVVVPWRLSNVLAGTPVLGAPGVWSAKHAAEYRNWWWRHGRRTWSDTSIAAPAGARAYGGREAVADRPRSDAGGNFGRLARTGLLTDWIRRQQRTEVAGIPARDCTEFFRRHAEWADPDELWERLRAGALAAAAESSTTRADEIADAIPRLMTVLSPDG